MSWPCVALKSEVVAGRLAKAGGAGGAILVGATAFGAGRAFKVEAGVVGATVAAGAFLASCATVAATAAFAFSGVTGDVLGIAVAATPVVISAFAANFVEGAVTGPVLAIAAPLTLAARVEAFAAGRAARESALAVEAFVEVFLVVFPTVFAAEITRLLTVDFVFAVVIALAGFLPFDFTLVLPVVLPVVLVDDLTAARAVALAAIFVLARALFTREAFAGCPDLVACAVLTCAVLACAVLVRAALVRTDFAAPRVVPDFEEDAPIRARVGFSAAFFTAARACVDDLEAPAFRGLSFFLADGIRWILLCGPAVETGQLYLAPARFATRPQVSH